MKMTQREETLGTSSEHFIHLVLVESKLFGFLCDSESLKVDSTAFRNKKPLF